MRASRASGSFAPIRAVGHVALRVVDLDAAVEHATAILGLRESLRVGGSVFLTCSRRHHCLEYIGADRVALDHVGLEARGPDAVRDLSERLREAGITVERWSEPGVVDAIRFEGPAGHVFELYGRMDRDQPAWYPTSGLHGRRFSHVTLKSDDVAETEIFLRRMLGFKVSDRVANGVGSWLRCNDDHHSLAVMRGGNGIHHYAFEVNHIGEVQRLGDLLAAHDKRLVFGPGRHGVGNNIFAYHYDPNRVLVEIIAELERIHDETHQPREWADDPRMENLWGPQPEDPDFNGRWVGLVRLDER